MGSETTVLVRVSSHRSRERLFRLLGSEPDAFYSFRDSGNFYAIPAERLDEARKIAGVTKARPKGELLRCWPSGASRA